MSNNTFQCCNCLEAFNVDDEFYSEILDDAYCEDCGQQAEEDERVNRMEYIQDLD